MLKQHEYYVYYEENRVYARMGDRAPVLAREYDSPGEAHDVVQRIVNPEGKRPEDFNQTTVITVNENGEDVETLVPSALGFNDPRFQQAISANCEAFVKEAYERAEED